MKPKILPHGGLVGSLFCKGLALVLFLGVFAKYGYSQEQELTNSPYYSIAYFGEMGFHPGIILDCTYSKYAGKDQPNYRNRLDYGIALSGYLHPNNHVGLRITPTLGIYHTFKKGFEIGIEGNIGYMHRFYQGKTYRVDSDGSVKEKSLAGQGSVSYGGVLSLGKNFQIAGGKPFRVFVELGSFYEFPYNEASILHPFISLGLSKYIKK